MNRDTKKKVKIIGKVYSEIVAIQMEEYCPKNACSIKIINVCVEQEK